jgi:hypothetical protein
MDLVREHIPQSMYTRAAFAWAAYEMSTGNTEMSILVRNPYTSNGEFALDRLVAILNEDGLVKKIARFRTDDSDIAYDLVHTFAKKIFNAHLPLPNVTSTCQGFGICKKTGSCLTGLTQPW